MIKIVSLSILCVLLAFSPIKEEAKTVVIDAGHGGKDNGATVEQTLEKEITWAIAQRLQAMSTDHVQIVLTRSADEFISLADRVEKVNELNPNLLLSLHVNMAGNTTANGLEIFSSAKAAFEKESDHFASAIVENWPLMTREANRHQSMFILNEVNCPALVVEMGFLSNPVEHDYLVSEQGQEEIAQALFLALSN